MGYKFRKLEMVKSKPDFIVPGFPKCGTTWLYDRLKELPDFDMIPIKEIAYFDRLEKYDSSNFLAKDRLFDRVKNLKWLLKSLGHVAMKIVKLDFVKARFFFNWYFSRYTDSWYLNLFEDRMGISGDVSPTYCLLSEEDLKTMFVIIPNIKVVLLLRDPIDRDWSHYRMMMGRRKREHSLSYLIDFLDTPTQKKYSEYLSFYDRLLRYVDKQNIYIEFYDNLVNDPSLFLQGIANFLGGKKEFVDNYASIEQRSNVSKKVDLDKSVLKVLMEKNEREMFDLHIRFGGVASVWYTKYFKGNL